MNPESVGIGAIAMVGVVLVRSMPESFADLPMGLDAHLVAGDFAYLRKIRVADMADFNRLHGDVLIALPEVRQARIFYVMKKVKDGAPVDV